MATEYQLHDDENGASKELLDKTDIKGSEPAALDVEKGEPDETTDDVTILQPAPWLLPCMYLSTTITLLVVVTAFHSLILNRKAKMITSYYGTMIIVPAMLTLATIKMWTSFKEEQNCKMAFHLSLPSIVLGGIIAILLIIHRVTF